MTRARRSKRDPSPPPEHDVDGAEADADRHDPAGSGRASSRDVRRAQAEALLMAGVSAAQAARRTGLGERTVRRYQAAMRNRLDAEVRARTRVAEDLLGRLAAAAEIALETLVTASATNWQAAARLLAIIGAQAPRQLEHAGPGGGPIDLADPAIRRALARVRAVARGRDARIVQLEARLRELGVELPDDSAAIDAADDTDTTEDPA